MSGNMKYESTPSECVVVYLSKIFVDYSVPDA